MTNLDKYKELISNMDLESFSGLFVGKCDICPRKHSEIDCHVDKDIKYNYEDCEKDIMDFLSEKLD